MIQMVTCFVRLSIQVHGMKHHSGFVKTVFKEWLCIQMFENCV